MAETSPSHPCVDPIAPEILQLVAELGPKKLNKFWNEFLLPTLLSSTPEKKCLCMKLALLILPSITESQVCVF